VSYTLNTIPNALSYFLGFMIPHFWGEPSEVIVELPIVRATDVATTVSHRNPNMKVTIRSPPYMARSRTSHRRVDPEVPIGRKVVNTRKVVLHARGLRGYAGQTRVSYGQPTLLKRQRAECVHANIVTPRTTISDPILFVSR
jgi:hypothetical protein